MLYCCWRLLDVLLLLRLFQKLVREVLCPTARLILESPVERLGEGEVTRAKVQRGRVQLWELVRCGDDRSRMVGGEEPGESGFERRRTGGRRDGVVEVTAGTVRTVGYLLSIGVKCF